MECRTCEGPMNLDRLILTDSKESNVLGFERWVCEPCGTRTVEVLYPKAGEVNNYGSYDSAED